MDGEVELYLFRRLYSSLGNMVWAVHREGFLCYVDTNCAIERSHLKMLYEYLIRMGRGDHICMDRSSFVIKIASDMENTTAVKCIFIKSFKLTSVLFNIF